MKQIFLDLRDIILEIKDSNNNQIIKYFDLWNRQLDFLAEDSPADYPAVYIEFLPIEWQTLGEGVQDADFEFRLHIATRWFGQTYSIAPQEIASEQLDYLDIPNKIFKVLQGSCITNTNNIIRTNTEFDHNHENYIETVETYRCHIIDTQAQAQPLQLNLNPIINR